MNAATAIDLAIPTSARVFVVEDEALIAMELSDRLTSLGYTVTGTTSRGEEALEIIGTGRRSADVILMDIHLAGALDGIQTASRLRERADIPVIFLSAYSDAELLGQAVKVEPFGYLVKPFEERELHATIQMALYKHVMERALRAANAQLEEKVRQRTAELAASRENLAVTLNSIGDAVLATDAHGRVTHLNPVAARLTGWTQADALGQPIGEVFNIIDETTRRPAPIPVSLVLATEECHSLPNHTALISRSGVELSIADSAAPIRDASGTTIGVVLVFRDETEARERRRLMTRQASMLAALHRVQEQFINAPEASEPFDDLVAVLVETTGSRTGFVGEILYTAQGEPTLHTQATTNVSGGGGSTLSSPQHDIGVTPRTSITTLFNAVMRAGGPLIANDPDNDPRGADLPPGHAITAFLGVPIHVGRQVVGMIGVANRPGGYDARVLAEIQPLLATYGSMIVARRHALHRRMAEESLRSLNASLEAKVERRAAALRSSLAMFETLATLSPVGIFRTDARGGFLYVNNRWCEVAGITQADVAGTGWMRTLHPEDHERVASQWQAAVRQGIGFNSEYRFVSRDGQITWVLEQAVPTTDAGGMMTGYVGTLTDVTEQKQMERALRVLSTELVTLEGDDFFRTLVQRLATALDCEFAFVGQCKPKEPDSLQVLALFEDGHLAESPANAVGNTARSALSCGRAVVVSNGARERNPQDDYLARQQIEAYAAVPLTDPIGNTTGFLAVLSRHPLAHPERVEAVLHVFGFSAAAEIERQRSAQRFHDLVEFSPDAIVMTDRTGTVRLANRKAETMFGWSREELIGNNVEMLVPSADRAKHFLLRTGLVESTGTQRLDLSRSNLCAQRKSGEEFPVDISLGSIETAEGVMIAAAVRDITDRKNAERQTSRTQRLESIGTLAGGIAHDLNNALTPIRMAIELLKDQHPQETEVLDTVERSANHASQMVRHLLAFAKGTEGRRVAVRPRQLIEEMETIVRGTFPKNIEIQLRVPDELPCVSGDPTQLHQVLLNLCVNARDAMPEGGTLLLEAGISDGASINALDAQQPMADRYVVLRVTDTGGGVPPDILDRIFDPFFTTKGPEAGTGLGLFTAAGIVKGHSGFIRVESRQPRGSAFSVYLPAQEAATAPPLETTPNPEFTGSGETILYVDDERDVRDTAAAVLKRLNLNPVMAEDGMTALIQAGEHRESLRAVITDVHMPHMEVLTFVRALRRVLPDIPIVVASGRLEGPLALELRKLGVTITLDKPFTQAMLANALRAALHGS